MTAPPNLTRDRQRLDEFKAKMEAASARAMQGGDYMAAALCAVPWLVELAEECLQRRAAAEPEAPTSTMRCNRCGKEVRTPHGWRGMTYAPCRECCDAIAEAKR